jgi:hypothetical protein
MAKITIRRLGPFRSLEPATPRRFPPPWSVEETEARFIVRDAYGQALAYVYFEEEKAIARADSIRIQSTNNASFRTMFPNRGAQMTHGK